ncbi:MAG: response regulator [Acidobacteria bacterium]|nr:response regulator [Acidobacteriota bacterium]
MNNPILIIDDSRHFAESVAELLQDENYAIEIALNGEEGLLKLEEAEFAVVLLDLKMPGMSGLEFLQQLEGKGLAERNYVIVLTGEITIENAVDSLRLGARDFVQKPAVVEQTDLFIHRIEKGFQWQRQRLVNEELMEEKRKALEESRLIVKSVGHDISGSYFTSLILKLRMAEKTFRKINAQLEEVPGLAHADQVRILNLSRDGLKRLEGVATLLGFIKELGDKLKHLGEAIAIDSKNMYPMDLTALARQTLELFAVYNANIKIRRDLYDQPLMILASGEDLNRVFMNILENAVRALDNGGVITVRTYKKNGWACIDFEDNGIGIPPEVQDKIWRPDYTNWSGESGTGLGLLICKKTVENHQGKIFLKSSPGEGTVFTIQFKLIKEGEEQHA